MGYVRNAYRSAKKTVASRYSSAKKTVASRYSSAKKTVAGRYSSVKAVAKSVVKAAVAVGSNLVKGVGVGLTKVKTSTWVFRPSPITGKIGATTTLKRALSDAGSKYPPAKPGTLKCVSRSKRLNRDANAALNYR